MNQLMAGTVCDYWSLNEKQVRKDIAYVDGMILIADICQRRESFDVELAGESPLGKES